MLCAVPPGDCQQHSSAFRDTRPPAPDARHYSTSASAEMQDTILKHIEDMGAAIRAEMRVELAGLKSQMSQCLGLLRSIAASKSPINPIFETRGNGDNIPVQNSAFAEKLISNESLDGLVSSSNVGGGEQQRQSLSGHLQSVFFSTESLDGLLTQTPIAVKTSNKRDSLSAESVIGISQMLSDDRITSGRATPSANVGFGAHDWGGAQPAASSLEEPVFGASKRTSAIKSGYSGRTSISFAKTHLPSMAKDDQFGYIESDDEDTTKNMTARSILRRTTSFNVGASDASDVFSSMSSIRGVTTRSAARRNVSTTPGPRPSPITAAGPLTRSGARLSMKVDHRAENHQLTTAACNHLQTPHTADDCDLTVKKNDAISSDETPGAHQRLSLPLWPRAPLTVDNRGQKKRHWTVGLFFGYPWQAIEGERPLCRVYIEVGKRFLAQTHTQDNESGNNTAAAEIKTTAAPTNESDKPKVHQLTWIIAKTTCYHNALIFEHPINEFTEVAASPDCEEDILLTFRDGYGGPPFEAEDGAVVDKSYGIRRDCAGFGDMEVECGGSNKENDDSMPLFGVMPTVPQGQFFKYVVKALTVELRQAIVTELMKRKKSYARKSMGAL